MIESGDFEYVLVRRADVENVANWWRAANDEIAACSPERAIKGMADAIWHLDRALKISPLREHL